MFFPPPKNWLPRYNWNIVESSVKHYNSNPNAEFTSRWSSSRASSYRSLQYINFANFENESLRIRFLPATTCGYPERIYSWEMYSCFIITHDMHDPMFQIRNILICWKLEQYFYLLLTSGMVYSYQSVATATVES